MEYKYIAIEGTASSYAEAIALCGSALKSGGCVGEKFAGECIKREDEFPTGLCTEIPVAIPHCKSEDIKESAICYLRLSKPVLFHRMDDDSETIATRSIFNIAIKGAGDHLDFLQKMIGFATDKELLEKLETINIVEVPAMLEQSLG